MKEQRLANKIIAMLEKAGFTPDQMLVVIQMAREKFEEMKASGWQPKEQDQSVFKTCLNAFQTAYKNQTGLDYSFQAKDGVALAGIIKKVSALIGTDAHVVTTFTMLINKLPEWYRTNAFSLPVINGKFNEIVATIKQNKNKPKDEYKERIARDLTGQ